VTVREGSGSHRVRVVEDPVTPCGDALGRGRRIDDGSIVAACPEELQELYGKGEDLLTDFERETAPLPPPNAGG
jgi:hypothetical protein